MSDEISTDDDDEFDYCGKPNDKVYFYKDNLGEWRWKRVAANGKTIGASSEGYQRLRSARENFRRAQMVMNLNTETEIIEINGEEA